MGKLDLEDELHVDKILNEVTEFNRHLDLTESEIVEEIRVRSIGGILQTHGKYSLKVSLRN